MRGGTFNTDYTPVCTSSLPNVSRLFINLNSAHRCELPPQGSTSIPEQRLHHLLSLNPGTFNSIPREPSLLTKNYYSRTSHRMIIRHILL